MTHSFGTVSPHQTALSVLNNLDPNCLILSDESERKRVVQEMTLYYEKKAKENLTVFNHENFGILQMEHKKMLDSVSAIISSKEKMSKLFPFYEEI